MSVAYSINFPPKFLNTSNKRLTEALNVQSSYHLQCVHCAHAVTVYISNCLGSLSLLFPCRILCSLSTEHCAAGCSPVNLCSLIASLFQNNTRQMFYRFYQVEKNLALWFAEFCRFIFISSAEFVIRKSIHRVL